jgi:predicted acylesterase/phospholipase RssA
MAGSDKDVSQAQINALDPADRPPFDRYCDVVLEGGVVNGVVYPGFLMEIARKFHFHAIAGASVGAIAAALAAACEYNRRFGSYNGFNQGLAKMPEDLAAWIDKDQSVTKIQSLFQPAKKIKRLFDFAVDVIGSRVNPANEDRMQKSKAADANSAIADQISTSNLAQASVFSLSTELYRKFLMHYSLLGRASQSSGFRIRSLLVLLLACGGLFASMNLGLLRATLTCGVLFILVFFLIWPGVLFLMDVYRLLLMPGFGMCTGMRADGDKNKSLVEWLHEGIQKSAQLPLHKPLTFGELWRAPGGPKDESGASLEKSIDLRMITTCLSQGRIYELPQKHSDTPIMFRLSELKDFFPESVIDHLRSSSSALDVYKNEFIARRFFERSLAEAKYQPGIVDKLAECQKKLQKIFDELEKPDSKDIRVLPAAALPIVVAARMSMSCPILFQAVPFLGLNLDKNTEDMEIVRLWFSDGGIGSNFPIHIFDQAIPKWPTLGLKLLDVAPRNSIRPRKSSKPRPILTYLPFFHYAGSEDNLVFPNDDQAFSFAGKRQTLGTFIQFVFSIYASAKDGNDQSYLRMPDIRNRVVRVYMNNRSKNALNLKISPDVIKWLGGTVGVQGGRNAADAYLADLQDDKYRSVVNLWQDHRWVRMRMLIDGLRQYLSGAGHAINSSQLPGCPGQATLRDQIADVTNTPHRIAKNIKATPQLRSLSDTETALTVDQAAQINAALDAIVALEEQLAQLDLPQAYVPQPQPVLRFKPQY